MLEAKGEREALNGTIVLTVDCRRDREWDREEDRG